MEYQKWQLSHFLIDFFPPLPALKQVLLSTLDSPIWKVNYHPLSPDVKALIEQKERGGRTTILVLSFIRKHLDKKNSVGKVIMKSGLNFWPMQAGFIVHPSFASYISRLISHSTGICALVSKHCASPVLSACTANADRSNENQQKSSLNISFSLSIPDPTQPHSFLL